MRNSKAHHPDCPAVSPALARPPFYLRLRSHALSRKNKLGMDECFIPGLPIVLGDDKRPQAKMYFEASSEGLTREENRVNTLSLKVEKKSKLTKRIKGRCDGELAAGWFMRYIHTVRGSAQLCNSCTRRCLFTYYGTYNPPMFSYSRNMYDMAMRILSLAVGCTYCRRFHACFQICDAAPHWHFSTFAGICCEGGGGEVTLSTGPSYIEGIIMLICVY